MLTIFTIPKPFKGKISFLQKNAINSWVLLHPSCEVILLGDEEGTSEVAKELNVRHIKEIEQNEYGTPILSSAFKRVQQEAKNDIICYVNADIILFPDILTAVGKLTYETYLIIGQRIDLQIDFSIDYSSDLWKETLRALISNYGRLHPPLGSDYFIFPKGTITNMPPFAVGRPGWDNWMISYAKQTGIPVIDATKCITVVHQNHDYMHIPKGNGKTYEGPEAEKNRSLIEGKKLLTIEDTNWYLTEEGLKRRFNLLRRTRATIGSYAVRIYNLGNSLKDWSKRI